jgi:hypothetical protein
MNAATRSRTIVTAGALTALAGASLEVFYYLFSADRTVHDLGVGAVLPGMIVANWGPRFSSVRANSTRPAQKLRPAPLAGPILAGVIVAASAILLGLFLSR